MIIVTGASSGIGAAAVIELTRQGHNVIAIGRNPIKIATVWDTMRAVAPDGTTVPEPISTDLSILSNVRELACTLLSLGQPIEALVNNAGVQPQSRRVTDDGNEFTFAVNHLAPFLLSNLLLDCLISSCGRVVTTSSSSHVYAKLDMEDLQLERNWSPRIAYANSKLANILFTHEFSRRTRVPAASFHPGGVRTELNREAPTKKFLRPLERLVFSKPEVGARTLTWLTSSEEGANPQALYYSKGKPAHCSEAAADATLAARFWDETARIITNPG